MYLPGREKNLCLMCVSTSNRQTLSSTHNSSPATLRKDFMKGEAEDFSKQTLQKQHLKKTLLYSNKDYATEVTLINF